MSFPLCVIPAAGKATRMGDLCKKTPKCLLEVNGQPLIRHIVEFWKDYVERFVVIVPSGMEDRVFDVLAIPYGNQLVPVRVVEEPHPRTCPASVIWGLEEVGCPRRFMVALGDCLCRGTFDFSGLSDFCGVAVMEGSTDFARSYAVGSAEDNAWGSEVVVQQVVEKPKLGLGFYFLNWLTLAHLEAASDMTDTMARIVKAGHLVKPVRFAGNYRNVTFPDDLRAFP